MNWNIYVIDFLNICLTRGVKKTECVGLTSNHNCYGVIVKHLQRYTVGSNIRIIKIKTKLLLFVLIFTARFKLTVGTYSEGNLFVVYDIKRHVFPTAPSPTTTHLIVCILYINWFFPSNYISTRIGSWLSRALLRVSNRDHIYCKSSVFVLFVCPFFYHWVIYHHDIGLNRISKSSFRY